MNRLQLSALLVLACLGSAAHATGFQNGSFETGPTPGGFTTLNAGDTSIAGWTVGDAGIDYIGSYWAASDGDRSVDLSALGAGSIAQTFDTVANQQYLVKFDLAGNPAGDPTVKNVRVSAGSDSMDYQFDTSGKSLGSMGWEGKSFTFTATGASSTLKFLSLTDTAYGPALDHVSVQAVPEPASLAALGLGALGLLRRRRK